MDHLKSRGIRHTNNPPKDLSDTYLKNATLRNQDNENNNENEQNEINEGEMIDFQKENTSEEDIIKSQMSMDDLIEENENLIEENEKLKKENEELRDQLVRKVAEFENFRKRTLKEKEDIIQFGNTQLLYELLELVDNIEKAYNTAKTNQDFDALLRGLELINQQAYKLMQDFDVSPIPINIGDDFDVDTQDALMTVPSDIPPGKVALILQKGYKIKDKVLRHAKVAVSQPKDDK
ncbi:MAG TPA: nucleotide exchange factor GrpE [Candidatus Kapabacteria bacterium]|jgi:molecular chaperone GrpE|nr:nucleotide exchange factor GrpE [Candidatus Kapabacteria bacterium]HOV92815.1 nucleotide exchange factor GrpE [Candidatus Kapabacteria bacterium]